MNPRTGDANESCYESHECRLILGIESLLDSKLTTRPIPEILYYVARFWRRTAMDFYRIGITYTYRLLCVLWFHASCQLGVRNEWTVDFPQTAN